MAQTSQDIKPEYTDEEIFTMLMMQFGAPPASKPPNYTTAKRKAEADYYNDVTSFLFAVNPGARIMWIIDMRNRFYRKHGVFCFDAIEY